MHRNLNFIVTEKVLIYLKATLSIPVVRVLISSNNNLENTVEESIDYNCPSSYHITYELFDIDYNEISSEDVSLYIDGVEFVIEKSKLINLKDVTLDLFIENNFPIFTFSKV